MKKRIPLAERTLPDYTRGEEICNMVTHIVGGSLGILALVFCPIIGTKHHNPYAIISGCLYGFCMLVLYAISSIYHGLSPRLKAKKVLQVLDHCSIYILIAGSYMPFALVTLREHNAALGWVLFGFVWALAALGITLNAIDLKKYDKFSMICYLLMGWCIVVRIDLIYKLIGGVGFMFLLVGGLAYTLGAVLYGIGKKHRYMHSAFHVFTVIGSLLHFLCIIFYVI